MILRYYLAILTVLLALLTLGRPPAAGAAVEPSSSPNSSQRVLTLSLPEAVSLGLKNNRRLQTSRREINSAASNYRAAKGGYYPTVTASLTSDQTFSTFVVGTTLQATQLHTGGLNLTANMPLDLSGAIGRTVQQALISFVTAKANYVVSSQSLVAQVYQEYYDLLRSQDTVKIDRGQVEQTAEQLRIAQERLKTGRVPEVDVMTAKVQFDNARNTLKTDEGVLEIAKSRLRNTLVIEQNIDLMPSDRLTFIPEKITFETGLKEALQNRVEIKSARLSLESARISLKSTYDPYLPTLSISAGYGYNISGRNPFESWRNRPSEPTYATGATINVPIFIFDGGVIRENKVRALIGIEQAEANLKESQETISFEMKNTITQMDNSRERVEINQSSIELARETLRIAEMRYGLGVSSYLEITDARNNLRTAELNYLTALIGYNNARISVYQALGRPLINISTQELSMPLPSLKGEKEVLDGKKR